MKTRTLLLLCAVLPAFVTAGCWPFGGGGGQPQPGFKAGGLQEAGTPVGGTIVIGNISIQGDWQFDNNNNAVGNTRHFGPQFCSGGPCSISDGRVPARWSIRPAIGVPCLLIPSGTQFDVSSGQTKNVECLVTFGFLVSSSPSSIDLQSPPPSFTITGSGFSTASGMPRIEYYDQYSGTLVASTTASWVSSDGSQLGAYTPDLSSVSSGTYSLVVSNINPDGTSELVGVTTIDAWGPIVIYEPPPDPLPCNPSNPCTY